MGRVGGKVARISGGQARYTRALAGRGVPRPDVACD
jgi:hypothetical protein